MKNDISIVPKVTLKLKINDVTIGAGTVELLKRIESTGSISAACLEMGMSYTKGIKLLRKLEKNIDSKVIISKAGGRNGGGTNITQEAKRFIERYEVLLNNLQNLANINTF